MELLACEDMELLLSRFAEMDVKDAIHGLFSGICSADNRVHWNAVACMGQVVARLAEQDIEEARIVMRRLLWSLNDESGGIGWGAPETMAEIMVHHQGLAEEYLHMLISYMREDGEELFQDGNFLEHEVLQRGLLWGVSRLAATKPGMLRERDIVPDLLAYLQSDDAGLRGLAAKALGLLRAEKALPHLQVLKSDDTKITILDEDMIRTVNAADLVTEAMLSITSQGSH